ncbi:hypothetical protein GOV04_00735 [Candidatus Woesearchaeota archaeon]|nr:hypothetical protein [Candidatus Woesearchaeota archaeon]
MKIFISLVGVLTILAGVLPLVDGFVSLPIPTSGMVYYLIIIAIGAVSLFYGFSNQVFGTQRFMTIMFALLILLGGLLPFIANFVTLPIPTSGAIYSAIIIVVGAITMFYGFKSF